MLFVSFNPLKLPLGYVESLLKAKFSLMYASPYAQEQKQETYYITRPVPQLQFISQPQFIPQPQYIAQPATQPAPVIDPEPQPGLELVPKCKPLYVPQAEPQQQPQYVPQTKPRFEFQYICQSEPQPQPRYEIHFESQPDPRYERQSEPESEPQNDPQPEPRYAAHCGSQTEPQCEAELDESEPETQRDTEPEHECDYEGETEVENESAPGSSTETREVRYQRSKARNCRFCPRKLDRKTRTQCNKCNQYICLDHEVRLCISCLSIMEIEHEKEKGVIAID